MMLSFTLCLGFTACGDDDDDDAPDSSSLLIGTWENVYTDEIDGTITESLIFEKDGTLVSKVSYSNYPDEYECLTLKWTLKGDITSEATLKVSGKDSDGTMTNVTYKATIAGNRLFLVDPDGDTWSWTKK